MKNKPRGYIIRSAAVAVLFWFAGVALTSAVSPNRWPGLSWRSAFPDNFGKPATQTKTLTFSDRVAYQRAIEDVYWCHRFWPKDRPNPSHAVHRKMYTDTAAAPNAGAPSNSVVA